jgi:hypothetical protein
MKPKYKKGQLVAVVRASSDVDLSDFGWDGDPSIYATCYPCKCCKGLPLLATITSDTPQLAMRTSGNDFFIYDAKFECGHINNYSLREDDLIPTNELIVELLT